MIFPPSFGVYVCFLVPTCCFKPAIAHTKALIAHTKAAILNTRTFDVEEYAFLSAVTDCG
jgi:hypothetical protein